MKLILGTFIFFSFFPAFSQSNEQTGTYISINNKFERWSNMTLNEDQTFSYSYGVGGCQATVTGTFSVNGSTLEFQNDPEFLNGSTTELIRIDSADVNIPTPFYPNLGLTNWKIGKNYIKPMDEVDSGCLHVTEKHKRK